MAQEAKMISQADVVESLAAEGLVSVSEGAGQPQKNMELAKFADALGKAVPEKTSDEVTITGLYAKTTEGKMVKLTNESVASVMAGLMGTNQLFPFMQRGYCGDANEIADGYYIYLKTGGEVAGVNGPEGLSAGVISQTSLPNIGHGANPKAQMAYQWNQARYEVYTRAYWNGAWSPWKRIDNFGANTLAELSSMVAGVITPPKVISFNRNSSTTYICIGGLFSQYTYSSISLIAQFSIWSLSAMTVNEMAYLKNNANNDGVVNAVFQCTETLKDLLYYKSADKTLWIKVDANSLGTIIISTTHNANLVGTSATSADGLVAVAS